MRRWQYQTVVYRLSQRFVEDMNDHGLNGWEAYQVVPMATVGGDPMPEGIVTVWYKREVIVP